MQRHLHVVDVTAFVAETHDHILKRLLIGNPTATRTWPVQNLKLVASAALEIISTY